MREQFLRVVHRHIVCSYIVGACVCTVTLNLDAYVPHAHFSHAHPRKYGSVAIGLMPLAAVQRARCRSAVSYSRIAAKLFSRYSEFEPADDVKPKR